jgi:MFS family permease
MPLGIGLIFSLLGDSTLYTVLPDPDIASQAGLTLGMVGVALGINRLTRIITNGPAGALYDRLPRRPLMIFSIFFGAISTMCYAVAQGPVIMILGRIIWGVSWSGIWVGANTIALDISRTDNRGELNGKLQMWFFSGAALSAFTGGLFTDLFGYRGGLWISALLTACAGIIWIIFLPETQSYSQQHPFNIQQQPHEKHFPWLIILKTSCPYFATRFVIAGVLTSTTIIWLSQFIKTGINIGDIVIPLATITGGFSSIRALSSIVGAPLIGFLSDRFKRRWGALVIVFILGIGGMILINLPWIVPAVTGALLVAITSGGTQAIVPSIIGDQIDRSEKSRAIGIVLSIGDLGSALGPPLALSLFPIIGLRNLYVIASIVFLITLIEAILFAKIETIDMK